MQDKFVDAIEEGKIVKVSESYARKEGLMILRKHLDLHEKLLEKERNPNKDVIEENRRVGMEELRKPLHWKGNKILRELVENFHWEIVKARKAKGLSRKQLAEALGENDNVLRMIENGILPKDDFILLNKIQSFLGINLRKDRGSFGQTMRSLIDESRVETKERKGGEEKAEKRKDNLLGEDIEIID